MKTARLLLIVCCLLAAFTLVTYAAELSQVQQQQQDDVLRAYGTFVLQCAWGLLLIIAAIYCSWMENKRANMCIARFGQKIFLVHRKNLQSFYPIAIALTLLEMRKSVNTTCENAQRPGESDESKVFHGKLFQDSADEFSSYPPNSAA